MILTRTPLRISLFGGGSDMPEFYRQNGWGAVLSFAIDKYVHVTVGDKFDGRTRVSYSRTENVDSPSELEHDLAREALRYFDLKGLEITSMADIPGEGSGLGSSSAFTVGLVRALDRYIDKDLNAHPNVYAQIAYEIEREMCGKAVGKQDHYAAAYGGVHYFCFNADESVTAELIPLTNERKYFLEENVMLFWTGRTRSATPLLEKQAYKLSGHETSITATRLRNLARDAHEIFLNGHLMNLGLILGESWQLKKNLTDVTTPEIDDIYAKAMDAGAWGGKITGAGGGGFMIFIAEKKHQRAIEEAIGLRRVRFQVEERGSTVLYRGE